MLISIAASVSDDPIKWALKNKARSKRKHKPTRTVTHGAFTLEWFDAKGEDDLAGQVFAIETSTHEVVGDAMGFIDGDKLVGTVEVRKDMRRKGVATIMYDLIEKESGMKFRPDDSHTKDAENFWKNRMKLNVSIAASPGSADALLKILIGVLKADEFNYGKNFRNKLQKWSTEAAPFLDQFSIKRVFQKPIELMIAGEDISDPKYSLMVKACFDKLKEKKKAFEKDTSLTKVQLGLFNDIRLAYNKSESANKRLMNIAGVFKDSHISQMFMHEDEHTETTTQDALYTRLEEHVKKYGKVKGNVMPETVLTEWREKAKEIGSNLPQHQDYLDMRRQRKAVADKAIANIVRASGEHILDVKEIKEKLGNVQNDIPDWYVGKMDDKGNFYTETGLQLLNKPIGIGQMNPNYNPDDDNAYVCKYKAPFAQNFTNVQTIKSRTEGRVESFGIVQSMLPDLQKYVKKWLPDLNKGPGTLRGSCAVVCEIIYLASARIGSTRANTAGETTYGISTLLRKHLNFNDQRVIMTYLGKKAGKQKHVIKFTDQRTEMLRESIAEFIHGKKPSEYAFTFRGKPVSNSQINGYLRELGFPEGFTIHKMRKLKGTGMAKILMDKCPLGSRATDTQVNKWIEDQCLKIGKELGHMSGDKVTATTAIANYIDPSVFAPVFEKTNTRPNSKIQKAMDLAIKSEE